MVTPIRTLTVPTEPMTRRPWVIYQLRLRGLSLRMLGAEVGVSHNALSKALLCPSLRLEKVLAEAIGLTVVDLFPERHDQAGNRLPLVRGYKPTAPQVVRHGKKTRVA